MPEMIRRRLLLMHDRSNRYFERSHRTLAKPIPEGSRVKLLDPNPENKLAQRFVGDYLVEQRMNDGSYLLKDSDGRWLGRTVDISQLKLISKPQQHSDSARQSWQFEKLLAARGPPEAREYLVRWKGDYEDSWEPHANFVDTAMISSFERDLAALEHQQSTTFTRPRSRRSAPRHPEVRRSTRNRRNSDHSIDP